ncbi:collagen alpha-2(IV) chain, partial [Trichinella spiralis]|uniref:collagen alpha-2(IV) chain n=1 Tax=Trichinella spiralis TaxID=6334 RepID=UPI0001EFDCAA
MWHLVLAPCLRTPEVNIHSRSKGSSCYWRYFFFMLKDANHGSLGLPGSVGPPGPPGFPGAAGIKAMKGEPALAFRGMKGEK